MWIETAQAVPPITPGVQLFPNADPKHCDIQVVVGDAPSITSGDLSVSIQTKPYTFTINSPKGVLTRSHPKGQFIADVAHRWTATSASSTTCLATDTSANPYRSVDPISVRYAVQELGISPGETFYGFGEQFGAFVKNGNHSAVSLPHRCAFHDTLLTRCLCRANYQYLESGWRNCLGTSLQMRTILFQ